MKLSDLCAKLLFDYELLGLEECRRVASKLPPKLLRWLGSHHPDNRTRRIFFELTGIKIGNETVINAGFMVSDGYLPLLTIGNRVAISPNVVVVCQSGPNNSLLKDVPYVRKHLILEKPVVIGDDAWIGSNTIILPGVTIGSKAVIGAGAVVCRNVLPNRVYYGAPARHGRSLDQEEI